MGVPSPEIVALFPTVPADAVWETEAGIYEKCEWLATNLFSHQERMEMKFTRVVSMARGSFQPALLLGHRLGLRAPQFVNVSITSYPEDNIQAGEFEIGQWFQPQDVTQQDILLVDEICDTGRTMRYTHDEAMKYGARSVTTAVLFHKPARSIDFTPDYYAATTDKHVVFPWEVFAKAIGHYSVPQLAEAVN